MSLTKHRDYSAAPRVVVTDVTHSEHCLDVSVDISKDDPSCAVRLDCDFTWIVGYHDHMTTMAHSSWREMTTKSFQRIVYPGDHFFIFNDKERDVEIAEECARAIKRSLLLN
jgi:hypothetical protein